MHCCGSVIIVRYSWRCYDSKNNYQFAPTKYCANHTKLFAIIANLLYTLVCHQFSLSSIKHYKLIAQATNINLLSSNLLATMKVAIQIEIEIGIYYSNK